MMNRFRMAMFAALISGAAGLAAPKLAFSQVPEDPCGPGGGGSRTDFTSADDASGSRYRKIGLNGFPIPDEKPQQQAETDEDDEETYIDAYNHHLVHQVTDIFVPLNGSDLSVSVRRNWSSEIWDLGGRLGPGWEEMGFPYNRPDRPFGAGWRSNISANIQFSYYYNGGSPSFATVTDEAGSSYRFLVAWTTGGIAFFPVPENRHQQEVLATTLEAVDETTFVFKKKYGTTLRFELSDFWANTANWIRPTTTYDRGTQAAITWARLDYVQDRCGTKVQFEYDSGNEGIIPNRISSRGIELTITASNNRVTAIEDPRGNVYEYEYSSLSYEGVFSGVDDIWDQEYETLESVIRPDETTTEYEYSGVSEIEPTQAGLNQPNWIYYLDLAGITDPNGNAFTLAYAFDRSRWSYLNSEDFSGWYQPPGNPRNVISVSLPDSTGASFDNLSSIWPEFGLLISEGTIEGIRQMTVTDAKGGNWTYDFTEGTVIRLDEMEDFLTYDSNYTSIPLLVLFEKMTVTTPEGGEMVAEFEKSAGMALKSFKDVGATEATTFAYGDVFDHELKFPWISVPAAAQLPTQYWGDPTSQTNGEGKTKTFEYDETWRVMEKITDEEGRITEYDIHSTNGNRLSETIRDGGTICQTTEFSYASGALSGALTQKTVKSLSGDPSWADDLVTDYALQSVTGRVTKETRGSSETLFSYDANNNKTETTDPNGNVTTFEYDELNRLVEVDPPGTGKKELFYDARGNKIREKDESGNSTLWVYDNLNRVIKQGRDMNNDQALTSADIVTETTYNPLNSKLTVKSPNGHTTTMTYDGLNRLTKTKDPYNEETLFEFGTNSGGLQFGKDFQPVKITDPRGYQTLTTFDANSRPTEKQVQYTWSGSTRIFATTKWEYDDVGNVLKEYDPLHTTGTPRITERTYDALNRELTTTWPDSTGTQTFYTTTGLKWKTVDELSNDAEMEYDNQGRPVKTLSPQVVIGTTGTMGRAMTLTAYDAAGNATQTTNPLGFVWTSTYDARNRKIAEVRPGTGSPTTHTAYDAVGNVIKITDALGKETDTEYDVANRPVEITQPAVLVAGSGTMRPVTTKAYDKNGNVTSVTDPNGHETVNTYDMLNRLVATEDAEGIVVENEYDEVGNRTAVIDGLEQRTEFEYDGLNRNTKITDALNNSTTFAFNAVDKTARVDAMSQRTEYAYDTRHRLTQVSYKNPGGTAVNTSINATRDYVYDATGNLLTVTESAKSGKADVVYSYDALKRQLTETSGGLTHNYRYDLAGNRVYCLYGGLSVPLESTYDAENRLSTLTQGTAVTTYTYDANGNTLTKTLPNGDVATSQYDALSRTTSLIGTTGSSAALYSYAYLYDAAGNVKQVTENYANTSLNRVVTNEYDAINRLTEEEVTGSGALTTGFVYDDANNRESLTKGGVTTDYTYNDVNQLVAHTTGTSTATYTYDDNGNRVNRAVSGGNATYTYDYENRLVVVEGSGSIGINIYAYDYRTRRVERLRPTGGDLETTKVVFSGGQSCRELEVGTGTSKVDFVRGSDYGGGVGGILYTVRSGTASYTHNNRRGDIVAKTSGSGAITYQATYEAFGKRTAETGSTADRQKANSKDEDPTGLLNEGFRFRDLETGTFITKDPAGFVDGPNLYTYVRQNPWTAFDPDGLKAKIEKSTRTNKDGSTTKVTNISITGKVDFQGQSAKLTQKQQQRIVDRIEKGIKKGFEKSGKSEEVNVSVDLKIADASENRIQKDDHVIRVVDNASSYVNPKGEVVIPERGNPHAGTGGISILGGMVANLKFGFVTDRRPLMFEKIAAHEFGHLMGLQHANANDPNTTSSEREAGGASGIDTENRNPINNVPQGNLMRYNKNQGWGITSQQVDSISPDRINRGNNDEKMGYVND